MKLDMNLPKIVAMYRIKNEERWIERSLKSAAEICDEIVVLDDDSTDNTLQICKNFNKVVDIHHQSNVPFDETRDKNTLLQMALKRNPDFILTIDGDEIIVPNMRKILFEELNQYPDARVFEFQFLYVWDKENQCRYDGVFGNTWQKRLIRVKDQPVNLHFEGTRYPGNAHCAGIPANTRGMDNSVRSRVKILHYGYYDDSLRQKKFKFYNDLDPNNVDFDGYRHIISGNAKFSGSEGMEFKTVDEILADNKKTPQNNTTSQSYMKFTGERLIPNIPELTFLYQEHIVRYIFASQFVKSKIILDAACGTGYGSSLMSERGAKKVVGVDISKEATDYCNQHYEKENLEFKIGDCTKLNLADSHFDVIASFEAIEHIKEADSFLAEIKRVLKKNGLFIVSTPNKLTYQGTNPFHMKEYTEEEFLNLLKKYFSHVEIFYQSYPSSLAIFKPGKNDRIEEIDIPNLEIKNNDSAMYFVALCSDKLHDYRNKLYLFNNKTLLQEEYSTLKRRINKLENELKTKSLEVFALESKLAISKSDDPKSVLSDNLEKKIVELQCLLNDANNKLNNMYYSFTNKALLTNVEEIIDKLYREILARPPDELAIKHFLPRLINNDMSEQDLRKILLESEEAKALEK